MSSVWCQPVYQAAIYYCSDTSEHARCWSFFQVIYIFPEQIMSNWWFLSTNVIKQAKRQMWGFHFDEWPEAWTKWPPFCKWHVFNFFRSFARVNWPWISQHWLRSGLCAEQAASRYLDQIYDQIHGPHLCVTWPQWVNLKGPFTSLWTSVSSTISSNHYLSWSSSPNTPLPDCQFTFAL